MSTARVSTLLLPLLILSLLLGACDDSITDPGNGDDGPDPQPDPVEDSLEEIVGIWDLT